MNGEGSGDGEGHFWGGVRADSGVANGCTLTGNESSGHGVATGWRAGSCGRILEGDLLWGRRARGSPANIRVHQEGKKHFCLKRRGTQQKKIERAVTSENAPRDIRDPSVPSLRWSQRSFPE